MEVSDALEEAIKAAAAGRAAESGVDASASDFDISWILEGAVPGAGVFVASCPKRPTGTFSVPGLVLDGGSPDVFPQDALTTAFRQWIDVEGGLHRPDDVARVATALFGGSTRIMIALDAESLDRVRAAVDNPSASALVSLPRNVEIDGAPGVEFWWWMATGVSRVQVHLDGRGIVATRQDPADSLAGT